MKRIIAMILTGITILVTTLSITGCGATEMNNALTMGQWLALIADSFAMENYIEEEPYFEQVPKDDYYFYAFQLAAEWDILEPSAEVSASTPVRWSDVLVTLVNAGAFLEEGATEEEKTEFAIANFDPSIRKYWGNRFIKLKEAVPLLDIAQKMWAGRVYTEKIETASFSESVKNYIEEENFVYSCQGDTVIMLADSAVDLAVGDVYTLPENGENVASINRVKSIEYVDDKIVIVNDETFSEEAMQYIESIKIRETSPIDFSNVVGIYDEYGNPIKYQVDETASEMGMGEQSYNVMPLGYNHQDSDVEYVQTGLFDNVKGSLKFEADGYEVTLGLSNDDASVKISKEIGSKDSRYREVKTEIYAKASFQDIVLTKDVDQSWGNIKSAIVKLDYKTTLEGGITREKSTDIGNPVGEGGHTSKQLDSVIKQYKEALKNFSKEVYDTKCKDEIYICKLTICGNRFVSVDFVIKGKVTAEGELKLVFEMEGAQGVEYRNGNIRYIKSTDVDTDFSAEGSFELTLAPGIELNILKKFCVIDLALDAGAGVSFGVTAHLMDIEGHALYSGDAALTMETAKELKDEEKQYTTAEAIKNLAEASGGTWKAYTEGVSIEICKGFCFEWKLYPILRFSVGGKIVDLLKVSASVEFLGSHNTILQGHIDFASEGLPSNIENVINSDSIIGGMAAALGIGADCALNFVPWDEAVEKTVEMEEEAGIDFDEEKAEIAIENFIMLSAIRVFLEPGQTYEIQIVGLPEGYDLEDLVVEIEDSDIASLDVESGQITANSKSGTTQVVIKTKDEKYKAYCAVTVSAPVTINL